MISDSQFVGVESLDAGLLKDSVLEFQNQSTLNSDEEQDREAGKKTWQREKTPGRVSNQFFSLKISSMSIFSKQSYSLKLYQSLLKISFAIRMIQMGKSGFKIQ